MRSDIVGQSGDQDSELRDSREEVSESCCSVGNREGDQASGIASRCAVAAIRAYQFVSRHTPAVCRFAPTCSEYTRQAIVRYGFFKGCWLGLCRIGRCNPFNAGGYDPVP